MGRTDDYDPLTILHTLQECAVEARRNGDTMLSDELARTIIRVRRIQCADEPAEWGNE